MADKAIPDISLGGAEQNMSREELAAVAKAIAALSQEDRDLLGAVQESPYRLTTTEMEALGWEYLKEKLTIDLTDDLRAAIDPAPFGRHALEEDRGCFTSRGYLYPSGDEWQHDRPQEKPADRKPSIKERLEQSKQECMGKNKEPAPHKGKSEPEL